MGENEPADMQRLLESLPWGKAIDREVIEKIRQEVNRRKPYEIILEIMGKEVDYIKGLSQGNPKVDKAIGGYRRFIMEVGFAFASLNPEVRSAYVTFEFQLETILKRQSGTSPASADESIIQAQENINLLRDDPRGFSLADRLVERISKEGATSAEYFGITHAADRYKELYQEIEKIN